MLPWSVHARNAWLIVRRILLTEQRFKKMSNLKVRLSQLTNKKVPALALVVVAMMGMVAGVLAANIVITQANYTGEIGTYHNNTGAFAVVDNGLAVVANTVANNGTTAVTFSTSTQQLYVNTITAGHWMDSLVFTPPATSGSHVVTITVRSGTGALGATSLASITTAAWTTNANTGAVTVYVDLGVSPITAPVTVYVNVT
jgi:hypothetical protein